MQLTSTKQKLNQSANVDNVTVSDLKFKLERLEAEREEEKARYQSKIAGMEAQLHEESQRACEVVENQLHTQRMQFTIFPQENYPEKKVIELRKKKEEVGSERDAALHATDSHKEHADNAKENNAFVETYIENMESQARK